MKGKTIIKIQGHLNGKWKDCFEGMEIGVRVSLEEKETSVLALALTLALFPCPEQIKVAY